MRSRSSESFPKPSASTRTTAERQDLTRFQSALLAEGASARAVFVNVASMDLRLGLRRWPAIGRTAAFHYLKSRRQHTSRAVDTWISFAQTCLA